MRYLNPEVILLLLRTAPRERERKESTVKNANWQIKYHTEELVKMKKIEQERIEAYDRLVSEVERILGKEVKP